ncbi:MAG: 2-hydroxyacid dehydrogenase [Rubrivivax sp.]
MRIFFAADIDPPEAQGWLEALQAACPGHDWLSLPEPGLAGLQPVQADVAVVANPPPGVLSQVQGLRLIQSLWAGVDRLLADRTVPEGPPLARMVDPMMTAAMVQSALWAVTALHRGFFHYAQQQRAALWHQSPQRRASEVRVLVLGLGTMGAAVAAALAAQGYGVTAWRRQPADGGDGAGAVGQTPPGVSVLCGSSGLAVGLEGADVVMNLLPLTPHTRGMVNASFLSQLKAGAALVNFGRGAHVVEADLLQALDAGRLSHAVLDVFATEPLPPEHAFWHHHRVTVLPHVAALTDLRSAADVVADNLARLQAGRPLRHLVDRQRGY